jgi:hypothetical protein
LAKHAKTFLDLAPSIIGVLTEMGVTSLQALGLKEWGANLRTAVDVTRQMHAARAAQIAEEMRQLAAASLQVADDQEPAARAGDKLIDTWQEQIATAKILRNSTDFLRGISTGRATDIAKQAAGAAAMNELNILRNQAITLDKIEAQEKTRQDAVERTKSLLTAQSTPLLKLRQDLAAIAVAWNTGAIRSVYDYQAAVAAAHKAFADASPIHKFAKSLKEQTKTPLQTMREEVARIQAAFSAGLVTKDDAALGILNAQKAFQEATKKDAVDPQPFRQAALERGTAAAFSASFGPVEKPLDKIAQIDKQILAVQKRIDAKLAREPVVVTFN